MSEERTPLAFIIVVILLFVGAYAFGQSDYGYWGKLANEEAEQEATWDEFEANHDCVYIGQDSLGALRGAQYLCEVNNATVFLTLKSDFNWHTTKVVVE